jgi:hypothetical protein
VSATVTSHEEKTTKRISLLYTFTYMSLLYTILF